MSAIVDVQALHEALDAARQTRGWSWRQLARELELTPSTMSRLANGQKPDVDAFATMVSWLAVDADDFIVAEDAMRRRTERDQPDLLAAVTMLLRARDLDERDVEHIKAVVEVATRRYNVERSTAGE
jgi:transcriptional regulator with XRE-family HTH domain